MHVVAFPRNVVTAGGMYTSNNGHKIIVNANDSVQNSGLTGTVALLTGSSRGSIIAIIGFFVVGGLLLAFVDVEEGQRSARAEDKAAEVDALAEI